MGNLINLATKKLEDSPHISGRARCLDCKHEWFAVAPISTTWMECPKCSLIRGRFIYQHERDRLHWECKCGCDLFCVTSEGYYCPNCGEWQQGF